MGLRFRVQFSQMIGESTPEMPLFYLEKLCSAFQGKICPPKLAAQLFELSMIMRQNWVPKKWDTHEYMTPP